MQSDERSIDSRGYRLERLVDVLVYHLFLSPHLRPGVVYQADEIHFPTAICVNAAICFCITLSSGPGHGHAADI
jgi:hypothetical protein